MSIGNTVRSRLNFFTKSSRFGIGSDLRSLKLVVASIVGILSADTVGSGEDERIYVNP